MSAILATALVFMLIWFTSLAVARNYVYQSMVTLWRDAAEKSPDKRRTRQNYAHALVQTAGESGDAQLYWQALSEFQAMLRLPDDGSADLRNFYLDMGLIHYHLRMEEDAIRYWREGLEFFPDDAPLKSNIAFALFRMGRSAEALTYALEARQDDPMLPEAANALAWVRWERGEYQLAAEQFDHLLTLRPENTMAYWNAAVAYERAGSYAQARTRALQYLERETNPEHRATAQSFLRDISARPEERRR